MAAAGALAACGGSGASTPAAAALAAVLVDAAPEAAGVDAPEPPQAARARCV